MTMLRMFGEILLYIWPVNWLINGWFIWDWKWLGLMFIIYPDCSSHYSIYIFLIIFFCIPRLWVSSVVMHEYGDQGVVDCDGSGGAVGFYVVVRGVWWIGGYGEIDKAISFKGI